MVVLALTASRANFPIFQAPWFVPASTLASASVSTPAGARKSEEMTPSRRYLESRRTSGMVSQRSESSPVVDPIGRASEFALSRDELRPNSSRDVSRAQPDYLQCFLRTSQHTTLPPPG